MRRRLLLLSIVMASTACGGGGSHSIQAGTYRVTNAAGDDPCHLRPLSEETVDISVSDTGNTIYIQNDSDLGSKEDFSLTLSREGSDLSASTSYGWPLGQFDCWIQYHDVVDGSVTGDNRFHLKLTETMTATGSDCVGVPSTCHLTVDGTYRPE